MKKNKQDLYIFIIMIGLIGLTIGYAALSSTLNINGKSNISKNTWDVYFDNVVVKDDSVEAVKIPTVTDKTTVDFEVALNLPGDFYEFTVDVVNDGTIDAMIESVVKEPELTDDQKKYLNYIIEYENGEQISKNQLVKVKEFVRLKVRVELRKDIEVSDLPDVGDVLYLGFTVNYQQADESGSNVVDNGVKNVFRIINGDLNTPGSEVAIDDQNFYVLSSDENTITMLAKHALHIGKKIDLVEDGSYLMMPISSPSNKQLSPLLEPNFIDGPQTSQTPSFGMEIFSNDAYWWDSANNKMKDEYELEISLTDQYGVYDISYVYDSNSTLYPYIENYGDYLKTLGAPIQEVRLINFIELMDLGCVLGSCRAAPSWVYSTTYWSGSSNNDKHVWCVMYHGTLGGYTINEGSFCNIRPVIVVNKN